MAEWGYGSDILPAVVAHRGASSTHPENTLASFEAALAAGADIVELDVRLTIDGIAVVLHDADVGRTTRGVGFVHEMTLEEVRRLDASGGRGPPAPIPTLSEVLELVSGRGGVDLEIKNIPGQPGFEPGRERAAEAAVAELERTGFRGPALISSFNPASIDRSRALEPELATGLLTTGDVDARAALGFVIESGHPWLCPAAETVLAAGSGFVRDAHSAGVRVGTWTVDDADRLAALFAWGVDAIATNDPGLAVRVRGGT